MGGWLPFPAHGSSEHFLGVLAHFHGEEAQESTEETEPAKAEGQFLIWAGFCAEPGFVLIHGRGWERWGKQQF